MTIKVHLEPTGICTGARSMQRISRALLAHMPSTYEPVSDSSQADLCVLYAIGHDAIGCAGNLGSGQRYVAIQCCLGTTGIEMWFKFWNKAALVWSYYDLLNYSDDNQFRFYHSPLGIDAEFLAHVNDDTNYRAPLVITSGFVSGPGAEPIEEVWEAARLTATPVIHIGPPNVQGVKGEYNVVFTQPNDRRLAEFLSQASFVAALRHVEGFEMMGAEGLVCGARPILFDQPATRRWYGDFGEYVPDVTGKELVSRLVSVLSRSRPVSEHERHAAKARFDWRTICDGFWSRVGTSYIVAEPNHYPFAKTKVNYGRNYQP